MIGIYKITNRINGKSYIGQSINIEKRFKQHCTGDKQLIDKVISKYGKENFTFEILEECSIEKLDEREIKWISFYDSFKHGYNLTTGGQFNKNAIQWQTVKDKLNPYKLKDSTWLVYFYLYSIGQPLHDMIILPSVSNWSKIYKQLNLSKSTFYRAMDSLQAKNILSEDKQVLKSLTFTVLPKQIDNILKLTDYKEVIPIRLYLLFLLTLEINEQLTIRRICTCFNYSINSDSYNKIKQKVELLNDTDFIFIGC